MKEYKIITAENADSWECVSTEEIEECLWSPNRAPKAQLQGVFLKEKGLVFHLKSFAPVERAESWEPDSAVWEDNCLEYFFSSDGKKYVNLEVNANSALRASIGYDRHERTFLMETGCEMPQVSAVEGEDGWEVFLFVSCSTFKELFGTELKQGTELKANFYSCGDKTSAPYYAAWNKVETETPDFHRPEFFGKLIIE